MTADIDIQDDVPDVIVNAERFRGSASSINSSLRTVDSTESPADSRYRGASSGYRSDDETLSTKEPTKPSANTNRSADNILPYGKHGSEHSCLQRCWLKDWWLELASISFSTVSIAAMILLLITTDGKALSEWHLPISPNTVVAIFGTFAKSSMLLVTTECISQLKWIYFQQKGQSLADLELFDSASRGPLGSLRLLWTINWRAVVCSTCAMLTLLALAMDPFAQQILQYSAESVALHNETASLSFVRSWKVVPSKEENEIRAMYRILSRVKRTTAFQCSTGNCTWTEYSSLGTCCDCEDVTAASKASRVITVLGNATRYALDWKYLTPLGLELHIPIELYSRGSDLVGIDGWPLIVAVARTTNNTGALTAIPPAYRLPELAVAHCSESVDLSDPLFRTSDLLEAKITPPQIQECKLYYCEMISSANFWNGMLHEHIKKRTPLNDYYTTDCGFKVSQECGHAKSPDGKNDTYVVGGYNSQILASMLLKFFNSLSHPAKDQNWGGSFAQAELWWPHNGNVSESMVDITRGVNEFMRHGSSSEWVSGTAYGSVPIIRARWVYLTLPVVVVLLAAMLLSISIILSMEKTQIVWKSSPLALLFHGPSGWGQIDLRDNSLSAMNTKAQTMFAKLSDDGNGVVMLARADPP